MILRLTLDVWYDTSGAERADTLPEDVEMLKKNLKALGDIAHAEGLFTEDTFITVDDYMSRVEEMP